MSQWRWLGCYSSFDEMLIFDRGCSRSTTHDASHSRARSPLARVFDRLIAGSKSGRRFESTPVLKKHDTDTGHRTDTKPSSSSSSAQVPDRNDTFF
jgi:hypothetical protein